MKYLMKKTMQLILFLFLSLFVFTSCGRAKTYNNGKVNVSIKMPKEMKPMSDAMIRSILDISDSDSKQTIEEELLPGIKGAKIIGYQWINNPETTILISELKLSKEQIKVSKNLRAIAKAMRPDFESDQIIKVKGVDTLFFKSYFGSMYEMFTVKNGKLYDVIAVVGETEDLEESSVADVMIKSTKFGANGLITGVIDGVLFPIKGIIHLFNKEVRFFATSNNGFTYILGFIIGVILLLIILGSGAKNKETKEE